MGIVPFRREKAQVVKNEALTETYGRCPYTAAKVSSFQSAAGPVRPVY
jgi:hypothetical protein